MELSAENISHMYDHLLLKKLFENKARKHITKKKGKQL